MWHVRIKIKLELKDNKSVSRIIYTFIKEKHSIWATFFATYFIDLKTLKIILFFNTIAIGLALNDLFFDNHYINMRYEDYVGFKLLSSLPKSVISFIIGGIAGFIFNQLTSPKKQYNSF